MNRGIIEMKQFNLLQQVLIHQVINRPSKVALVCNKNRYTYADIMQSIYYVKNLLIDAGVKRGDRVVVQTGNTLETVVIFWAVLFADAVISIIADDLDEDKIHYIIDDSGAKVFFSAKVTSSLQSNLLICSSLAKVFFTDTNSGEEVFSLRELNFSKGQFDSLEKIKFNNHELDLASIIYTSGSTGEPKGVMLTHRNMLAATASINQYLEHNENDIFLSALPLSFDYGLYQMIMAFSVGSTLILEKNVLLPMQLLRKIQAESVTVFPGVPTLYSLLFEHAKYGNFDSSSLRIVTNTGAALTRKHINLVKRLFPDASIYSMYGLTECKRCTYLPPSDIDKKPDSVGIAIPNTELWIVDETGQKLSANQVGQLVIRGATVMKGYWRKPEATAKRLKQGPFCGEMLLYTGDYGMLDDDGYLYFKGRMDEIIKYKGVKVSPVEIENLLSKLTEISEVAVLGMEDQLGEVRLVVCVSLVNQDNNINLVKQSIKEALSTSQQPSNIFILQSLPKNNNGKVDKKQLKHTIEEVLCNQSSGDLLKIA